MAGLTLTIGSKNFSSWSLRPWLLLKQAGIPFEESVILLKQSDAKEKIRRLSPSGKVPVLQDGEVVVWDSLAIVEYLNERFPKNHFWPVESEVRAYARSVCAEMHSGFQSMRQEMAMMCHGADPDKLTKISDQTRADIERICGIWRACRARYGAGGPYLFGRFTIADAYFAPVVVRFKTYGVVLDGVEAAYADTIWKLPAMRAWVEGAEAERPVKKS